MMIAEHGKYPESDTGQIQYPKRRLFGEIVKTFRETGKVVPVFSDKHLSDNWTDAKWIYDTAQEMKIPMMAGSSLPVLWRYPPIDVKRDAKLKEIVAVSYHRLDTYGFHALEMVQSLAERRQGGETGVKSVQCRVGSTVWEAEKEGVYDRKLLESALSRLKERPLKPGKRIEDLVPEPVLFTIYYEDGLKANIFTLNPAIAEWAVAWRSDRRPRNSINPVLDTGSKALSSFQLSAPGHRKDDADRQAHLARRADAADQRFARCAPHFQKEREPVAAHAASQHPIQIGLELATTAAPADGPAEPIPITGPGCLIPSGKPAMIGLQFDFVIHQNLQRFRYETGLGFAHRAGCCSAWGSSGRFAETAQGVSRPV